MREIITEKRSL